MIPTPVSAAEKAPELTGFVWQAAKNSAWTATKPTTDLMSNYEIRPAFELIRNRFFASHKPYSCVVSFELYADRL